MARTFPTQFIFRSRRAGGVTTYYVECPDGTESGGFATPGEADKHLKTLTKEHPFDVIHTLSDPRHLDDDVQTATAHRHHSDAMGEVSLALDGATHASNYVALLEDGEIQAIWRVADGEEITGDEPDPIHVVEDDDDDWKREIAMQAGMGGGCIAYNEVMGY